MKFNGKVIIMSQQNNGNLCFGIILIVAPIVALLFGSDEPAMQTDQAALIFTGMIFFGIVMIASANKKKIQTMNTAPTYQMPITQTVTSPVSYCPHCGASISVVEAQYCAICGKAVHVSSKTQHHGFSA